MSKRCILRHLRWNVLATVSVFVLGGVLSSTVNPSDAIADDTVARPFDQPSQLVLGAGVFNFDDGSGNVDPDDNSDPVMLQLDYRHGHRYFAGKGEHLQWGFGPQLGGFVNGDGGFMGYAGFFGEFILNDHILFVPTLSAGFYSQGGGRDLGGAFEFHEGITLAYRFENAHSLGVTLTHASNAGLYDDNPGVNSLMLSYSLPLSRLFGPDDDKSSMMAATVLHEDDTSGLKAGKTAELSASAKGGHAFIAPVVNTDGGQLNDKWGGMLAPVVETDDQIMILLNHTEDKR